MTTEEKLKTISQEIQKVPIPLDTSNLESLRNFGTNVFHVILNWDWQADTEYEVSNQYPILNDITDLSLNLEIPMSKENTKETFNELQETIAKLAKQAESL